MAYEDFTTYSEVDPNSYVTVATNKLSWADLRVVVDTYFYKDKGIDYFNEDFNCKFEISVSFTPNGDAPVGIVQWMIANDLDNYNGLIAASKDAICFRTYYNQGEELLKFYLGILEGGSESTDQWNYALRDTVYYIEIVRDDDGGANNTGRLTAYIRTGSHEGLLKDTLIVDCGVGEQNDFQYVYGMCNKATEPGDDNYTIEGYTEKLEVAVRVDVIVTPSSFALALTQSNPVISLCSIIPNTDFSLVLELHAPTISTVVETIIEPSSFALALTRHEPTFISDFTGVMGFAFPLALTLPAPTIGDIITVSPDVLALALTLQTPVIISSYIVTPSSQNLALTLLAPVIDTGLPTIITPSSQNLALTLLAPEIIIVWTEIPPFMEKDLIDPWASGAWLWLVQIAVPGHDTVRIARNTEDVNYKENNFDKFNLRIGAQMFSGDGSIPRVTLQIHQDINRRIEDIVNETEGALGAQVKLIRVNEKFLTTSVDALEADYDNLASQSDTEWVTFTLGVPNPLIQRFPLRMYSSSMCPWATPTLYKGPDCQCVHADTTCTGTYEDCYVKGNAAHWGGELGLDPSVVEKTYA